MERIAKRQPRVGLSGFQTCLVMPIGWAIGFIQMFLSEVKNLEFSPRQVIQTERDAGVFFNFLPAGDQGLTGTADKQRGLAMNPDDFENLPGQRKIAGRDE